MPIDTFKDSVVVVTGAARGIGRAVAVAFAERGARVAVLDVNAEQLQQTVEHLGRVGSICLGLVCDVGDEVAVRATVERVERELGPIEVLVNNAGVGLQGTVETISLRDWERVLRVNLTGTFLMTREVLRAGMLARNRGCIINIASRGGLAGFPRYSAYCASKFAVVGFTRSVAEELRKSGIRVNAVCPSEVDTEMNRASHPAETDRSAWADPRQVANVILLVASSEAGLLQGAVVEAYGKA